MDCDLVIHNGAITDHNEIEEYKMAKEKLKKIRHPLIIIPGRHDVKDLGWELFPLMIGPMDPVFENDKLKVLGINSNDRNMSNGNVGRKAVKDTANYFKQHCCIVPDRYLLSYENSTLRYQPRLLLQH